MDGSARHGTPASTGRVRKLAVALWVAATYFAPACSSAPAVPTSCMSSRECSALGLVCDIASSRCVECVTAVDCLGASQVCRANACVTVTPCTTSRMCPGQVCDLGAGFCVDCVADGDCAAGQVCTANVCGAAPTPCVSDRECSTSMQVCDVARGVCVDCVRDADCGAGQHCVAGTCHAGGVDAGMDSGVDSGIDAAGTMPDAPVAGDAGPNDAHVSIDAAMPVDAAVGTDSATGCVDDGASDLCATATPIGTGAMTVGETRMGTIGSLPVAGSAAWYTIQFPPTGGSMPHVDFAMNDSASFAFDVFGDCGGTVGACTSGEGAAGLTAWDFNDGCVPSVCHSSRAVAWPAQLWIRVRRLTVSASCTYYQLRVSDLPSTCEASTVDHCGAACSNCTLDIRNASGATCTAGGACDYTSCNSGAADCDGDRGNGCEFWSAGACGATCTDCAVTLMHTSTAACSGTGTCQPMACATGYANCDGVATNGCERATAATAADCCGAACTSPATCMGSAPGGYTCR